MYTKRIYLILYLTSKEESFYINSHGHYKHVVFFYFFSSFFACYVKSILTAYMILLPPCDFIKKIKIIYYNKKLRYTMRVRTQIFCVLKKKASAYMYIQKQN